MSEGKSVTAIKSITGTELMCRHFPEREEIISPWLRDGETAIVWAASGLGKTMLCLSLALAVAGGGVVGPWEASEARKVLYVDGEMNLQDIRDRLRHLLNTGAVELPYTSEAEALGNLIIEARQDQSVGADFYDLTMSDGRTEIVKRAQRNGCELVILDNLTTLSDNLEDENDTVSFKSLQGFFMELKRAGIATILVHHANKTGNSPRGSTALATTFEVILGLTDPSLPTPGSASFKATFGKYRGKGDHRINPTEWRLAEAGWQTGEAEPADMTEDHVYRALRSLEFVNQSEVAERLGLTQSTVSRRISRLVSYGVLKKGEHLEWFCEAKKLREEVPVLDEDIDTF